MTRGSDRALAEFLSEAQEIVESLNRTILSLDELQRDGGDNAHELVNDSFRAVHSLKGLTGMFGLEGTARLSHGLETLLDALRLGRVDVTSIVVDLLFEAVELFSAGLAAAADGGDLDAALIKSYLDRIDDIPSETLTAATVREDEDELAAYEFDASVVSVLTEYEEHRLRQLIREGKTIYRITTLFDLLTIDTGIEQLRQAIQLIGEIITYVPGGDGDDPDKLEMVILVGSGAALDTVAAAAGDNATVDAVASATPEVPAIPSLGVRVPQRAEADSADSSAETDPVPAPAASAGQVSSLRSVSQSVRVDIRRLDALMNAVGELNLVHSGLSALMDRMVGDGLVDHVRDLCREVRSLERRAAELQDGILEVRMVPLRQIFDKLSRVVRKISRTIDKQIGLDIGGGETELDKLIVEELSDPLMHIIRNAIDHGIETPGERVAQGKPEVGTIKVRALQQGNRVVISVADDGRGIDELAVADAAVRRGVVDVGAVESLNRRELLNLLFLPGMSTRQTATELSGRGVGLDVVKTNIANLSGIIDMTSTPGHGTETTITLPVTLAIIQAIVVKVAGRTYAIPCNTVVESVMVDAGEIRTIEGREVITVRNQTLRLARVERTFRLDRPPSVPVPNPLYVVIVGVAQHRLGLVVDELLSNQDVVIKSLGPALASVPGIAGATELPGQQTVLVLDIPKLIEESVAQTAQTEAA